MLINKLVGNLWIDILGQDSANLFSHEAFCSFVYMFAALLLKAALQDYLPLGIFFSLPIFVNMFDIPNFTLPAGRKYQIFPVRIAECILGRLSMTRLGVIFAANIVGYFLGAITSLYLLTLLPVTITPNVLFGTWVSSTSGITLSVVKTGATTATSYQAASKLASSLPSSKTNMELLSMMRSSGVHVLMALFADKTMLMCIFVDSLVVMLYTITIIVLPELLHMHHATTMILPIILVPLLIAHSALFQAFSPQYELSFMNPLAINMCKNFLWLTSYDTVQSTPIYLTVISDSGLLLTNLISASWIYFCSQSACMHYIGPVLGAILAGIFCIKYFPDDLSWKRVY